MQDGRSSRAMLRLIQDIREYRNRGLLIDPRGFDSMVLSTTDRDRMMALNLHELVRNAPYDHVIILAGNYHARRTSPFLGVGRRPMASYFDRGELLTVQVRFLGGSAWNCRRRNPCGVFEIPESTAYSTTRGILRMTSRHACLAGSTSVGVGRTSFPPGQRVPQQRHLARPVEQLRQRAGCFDRSLAHHHDAVHGHQKLLAGAAHHAQGPPLT